MHDYDRRCDNRNDYVYISSCQLATLDVIHQIISFVYSEGRKSIWKRVYYFRWRININRPLHQWHILNKTNNCLSLGMTYEAKESFTFYVDQMKCRKYFWMIYLLEFDSLSFLHTKNWLIWIRFMADVVCDIDRSHIRRQIRVIFVKFPIERKNFDDLLRISSHIQSMRIKYINLPIVGYLFVQSAYFNWWYTYLVWVSEKSFLTNNFVTIATGHNFVMAIEKCAIVKYIFRFGWENSENAIQFTSWMCVINAFIGN